jgi:hypothetical protein
VFLAPDIITAAIEGRLPHGYRYVENARRSDRAVAERPLFGAKAGRSRREADIAGGGLSACARARTGPLLGRGPTGRA